MSITLAHPKISGVTTVNKKGQVVIPAEVRHALNIQEGDQFVVISGEECGFGFIKADSLQEFVSAVQKIHPEAFSDISLSSSPLV